tara:strand:+ start:228 stop:734 length:507 start_codon:yes stop_codon:yes gene_type:complete
MSPPKRTRIKGQKHELAYINKDEKALLRSRGGGVTKGGGQLKRNGVNAYAPGGNAAGGAGQGQAGAGGNGGAGPGAAGGGVSGGTASATGQGAAGQGASISSSTLARIRRDDDIAIVAKGDTTGTGLSSSSTAQPVSAEAAAVKRRQAKDANQGLSGIDDREVIGLAG